MEGPVLVAYWPKADVGQRTANVGFRRESGLRHSEEAAGSGTPVQNDSGKKNLNLRNSNGINQLGWLGREDSNLRIAESKFVRHH
jgi:hypothetical protein